MKDQFYGAYGNGDQDKAAAILKAYLEENFPDTDREEYKIANLKLAFESDLPHNILADAIGCDVELCQRFRYYGEQLGVIDVTRKSGNRTSIPPSVREQVYDRDDHRCVRCGDTEELEIHHIVPVSHGGMNHIDNLAVLCESCNMEAHAGDYSTRRMVYVGKKQFWDRFVETKKGEPMR